MLASPAVASKNGSCSGLSPRPHSRVAAMVEECPTDEAKPQSPPAKQEQLSRLAFLALFVVCTVTYSMFTILLHLCETDLNGNYYWLTGSMVMVTEVAKLLLSVILLVGQRCLHGGSASEDESSQAAAAAAAAAADAGGSVVAGGIRLPQRVADLLPYGIPALLYAINNNIGAYLQLQMDSVSYQILSNLKILTTALLFRAIMRREITRVQWLALTILFLAGVTNSAGGLRETSLVSSRLHVTPAGLALLLVYCTISGLAGVYTEYVLKRQAVLSVHLQNSLLYVYGIGLNLAIFIAQTAIYRKEFNPLKGFSGITWALVASQAIGGITMGMLMKFASNIAKLFVVSTAMILTTVASVVLFNFAINAYCIVSFICVVLSQYLYYNGCPFVLPCK